MKLNELLDELDKYKVGLTEQSFSMRDYSFENDYIKVIRIDSSNKAGGELVKQGKQWSIIFERTTNLKFEDLLKFKELVRHSGYIKVTPRRNTPGIYGIRIYHMCKNPNNLIIDMILKYIFS